MDRQRRVPLFQFVDGIRHSPLVPPAMARKALVYRPGDGDIIVVTYPKSGTHWTLHIIQLILGRGQGATSFPDLIRRSPHLENHGPEALEGLPLPKMVVTHQKLLLQNFNDRAKYVYIARNPWDTCVSLYHFMRGITEFQFEDGTFDDFFEAFVTGDLCYGDYFDHVLHGYARKDDPNVFFFTYEQLKADTPGVILKLAYFLGEEYGKMLEGDQEMFRERMGAYLERFREKHRPLLLSASPRSPYWSPLSPRTAHRPRSSPPYQQPRSRPQFPCDQSQETRERGDVRRATWCPDGPLLYLVYDGGVTSTHTAEAIASSMAAEMPPLISLADVFRYDDFASGSLALLFPPTSIDIKCTSTAYKSCCAGIFYQWARQQRFSDDG
ncbi:hypothetical protein HPB47_006566 [Ixodes persulcatus]|uniref:Uncharacterized protein n=1 Tax=Ixodes persulcatus TaxID=34615 RepID=A0AC60PAJ0_IXOPE|nr:hypothetical protein HPB47_006566 [Ixodes persulcatus]